MSRLYRAVITSIMLAVLIFPAAILAAANTSPTVGNAAGTTVNGYFTTYYTIPVTANCNTGATINATFKASDIGAGLTGTHAVSFFSNNKGNVTYTIDSGAHVSFITGCPNGDTSHTLGRTITAKLDLKSPSVAISSPVSNSPQTGGASIKISGKVSDDASGIKSITVNGKAATITNGIFTASLVLPNATTNGYILSAIATDNAGRSSTSSAVSIKITSKTAIDQSGPTPSAPVSPAVIPAISPSTTPSITPTVALSTDDIPSPSIVPVIAPTETLTTKKTFIGSFGTVIGYSSLLLLILLVGFGAWLVVRKALIGSGPPYTMPQPGFHAKPAPVEPLPLIEPVIIEPQAPTAYDSPDPPTTSI